jgi:methionine aminotransferase
MQSKLPKVGTTIFTTMSKMAMDYQAINLSQGFPNFDVDPLLTEILAKNSRLNCHQYAPMPGNKQLLETIAELTKNQYQRSVSPETELLVTAGATQAIFATIHALVCTGDEVVVLDPAYDCYDPAVSLAGGKTIHISLNVDYSPNWQSIREAVTQKTKLLILNNPHNPTGKTMTASDLDQLIQLMEDRPNLLLLSDEVYEYICFEKSHLSINKYEKIYDRSVIVSSFGKTFHITGWKIGYLIAPENLMKEIKKVHQFLVFSVNSVAQQTLAEYIPQIDLSTLSDYYQQKRDRFRELLTASKFELLPCEGTYFQLAKYTAISNRSDVEFCTWLTQEIGVAAIPLSAFYDNHVDHHTIRFCFAKTDDTLTQASERLCKI